MSKGIVFLAIGLLGFGAAVLLAAFLFQVIFAGIPYPDPTPELAERYAWNTSIAGGLYACGCVAALAGVSAGAVWLIGRRRGA